MKLNQILSRMRQNDYIKVGTEFGSNFIVAGTVEAVSADIKQITPKLQKQCDHKMIQYKKAVREAVAKYGSSESEIEKGYLQAAQTRYARLEDTVRNFQPLDERKVIDSFYADRIMDGVYPVLVVMVEGVEDGRYTMVDASGKGVKMG